MSWTGRITDVFRQSKSNFQRSTSAKRGPKEQEELPGVSGIDAVSDGECLWGPHLQRTRQLRIRRAFSMHELLQVDWIV